MKTFVLMTKMAPRDADLIDLATRLKKRSRKECEWLEAVKFLAHYTLLGQWDFMDIYEAPDEEAAALVSILSRASGAYQVESWVAIPNSRLLGIAEALGKGESDSQ
jgi:uncharacterized protein with GYD domain